MSTSVTIQVKGLDAVIKKIDELSKGAKEGIEDALESFGMDVETMAKNIVPKDESRLAASIGFIKHDLSVKFFANVFYAAYVEFGTGNFAAAYVPSLPKELQEYARKFFVNGKGRVPQRPFMWPAIQANMGQLEQDIKDVFSL